MPWGNYFYLITMQIFLIPKRVSGLLWKGEEFLLKDLVN